MGCASLRILCLRRYNFLFAFLILFATAATVGAQDASTAAIRGIVTDSRSALLRGATVTVVNLNTGVRYSATTNEQGDIFSTCCLPGTTLPAPKPPECLRRSALEFTSMLGE